jgi:hypothetical protein
MVLRWPSDFIFWSLLLLLNALLFLPAYVLTQENTAFLPLHTFRRDVWGFLSDAVVSRPNYDLFRLNVEVWLFVTLWLFVKPLQRSWVRWTFSGIYLLAFAYAVYEAIVVFTFFMEPVFYSQSHMILAGVPFLIEHMHLPWPAYLVIGGLLLGFFVAVFLLIRWITVYARLDQLNRVSQVILLVGCGFILAMGLRFQGNLSSPEMVTSSFFAKLAQNLGGSLDIYQQVHDYNDDVVFDTYDYSGMELETRPNVYLIFIESYGSVLYKRKDWEPAYRDVLADVEADLKAAGWSVASALSEAPVWGGGSWMSYTSALFGLRIDNDAEYLALFDTYQHRDYPDLSSYLRGQGYHFAWLTSISSQLKKDKWEPYQRFYNIDQWLRFDDLDYTGPLVSWGPAPLDQYALNFARQAVTKETDAPIFFYTITQNSHYPWYELPAIADDWRHINDPDFPQPSAPPELIKHEAKRQNYFNTIRYELEVLSDFVRNDTEESSIYILIGDHQPPQVSRRDDGWETPIHIVSQDADFVESFLAYGFDPSMQVEIVEPVMRHEGLYSLLVRQLLLHYGKAGGDLPTYLPEGVSFESEVLTVEPSDPE